MPGFTLTDTALTEVRDTDLCGIRVFLTVPSLDTGVCDQEVRWFNEKRRNCRGDDCGGQPRPAFRPGPLVRRGRHRGRPNPVRLQARCFGKATGTYRGARPPRPRGLRGGRKRYGGIRRGGAGGEQPSQLRGRIPKSSGNSPDKSLLLDPFAEVGLRMCPVEKVRLIKEATRV